MEAYEAIMSRRSTPRPAGPAPDANTILELLNAAVRAPSHHLTQPWRFVVLGRPTLEAMGEIWAQDAMRHGKDPDAARSKAVRAPVAIAIIGTPKHHLPKVQEIEEHHAVGAAMQNILLAAHSRGLGAMLRTGPPAHIPEIKEFLGVGEGEYVAGLVYLGHKPEGDDQRPLSRRTPAAELTQWKGLDPPA